MEITIEIIKIVIITFLFGFLLWEGIDVKIGPLHYYVLPLKRFFNKKNK